MQTSVQKQLHSIKLLSCAIMWCSCRTASWCPDLLLHLPSPSPWCDCICGCLTLTSCPLSAWQRIKEGSVADGVKLICVGDHIECINGQDVLGIRHYDVARMLKDLPKDKMFTLKLVEPLKAFGESQTPGRVHDWPLWSGEYRPVWVCVCCFVFIRTDMLEPRSKGAKPANDNKIGNGKGTLRLRSKGPATVEDEVKLHGRLLPFICVEKQLLWNHTLCFCLQ